MIAAKPSLGRHRRRRCGSHVRNEEMVMMRRISLDDLAIIRCSGELHPLVVEGATGWVERLQAVHPRAAVTAW